jgi:hypothetical protein
VLTGGLADLLDHRLGRLLLQPLLLSHRHVHRGYDEPEPLPSSTHTINPIVLTTDNERLG